MSTERTTSVFEVSSDKVLSRRERLRQWFFNSIVVPFRILWDDWRTKLGILIIGFYVVMGTVGVVIIEPPATLQYPILKPPFQSIKYPLGTDRMGKDLLATVVHATPPMFKMVLAGAVFATVMATIVGTFSGLMGGWVDKVLTSFADIALTIPGLPLVIVLGFIIEPRNPYMVGLVLTINAWGGTARLIRSEVLSVRKSSYVEASKAMGLSNRRIVMFDLLPPLMPFILPNFVRKARRVIFSSVALYFLGILPFSHLNWGVMLNMAYKAGQGAPITDHTDHWVFLSMGAIVIFTLGLMLLSQGADRLYNPRIRARHQDNTEEAESTPEETTTTPVH